MDPAPKRGRGRPPRQADTSTDSPTRPEPTATTSTRGRPSNLDKARQTIDRTIRLMIVSLIPVDAVDAAIVAAYREELVDRTIDTIAPYPGLVSMFAGSEKVVAPLGLVSVIVPIAVGIAANHGQLDATGVLGSMLKPEVQDALRAKAQRQSEQQHPSSRNLSVVPEPS